MNNSATVLFVYGSLAPGEDNAHIMDGMVGEWRTATVRGKRHNKGWGRHKGYPGFVPDEEGDLVEGLVFISNDLPAHWARLDKFEGGDYARVNVKATLESTIENTQTIDAQIYSTV